MSNMADAERCISCGDIIPEGRQVCPMCEIKAIDANKLYNKMSQFFGTENGKVLPTEAYAILSAIEEAPAIRHNNPWIDINKATPVQPPDTYHDGHKWFCSGEDYLVADSEGRVFVAHWTFGCSSMNYFWLTNSLTTLKNITHWMPLPKAPERGGAK